MATNGFEVRRLSGSIGAEILGIDLASEPGDNVIRDIRQVWLQHNVIFFRDQDLPPAKFLAFARRFGEVIEYPFVKGIEGFPEIGHASVYAARKARPCTARLHPIPSGDFHVWHQSDVPRCPLFFRS